MATVGFDKDINGKIFGTKEGETTKVEFFFEEMFIKKASNGLHLHTWCDEQDGLYCWSKKGTDNPKATLPGRVYYFLPSDSKEAGVQCAYKVISNLEEGICYKGKLSVDGGLGVAEQLLSNDTMLGQMSMMFIMSSVVPEPKHLGADMAVEVEQKTYSKGGYSKGETKSEQISARTAAFLTLANDENKRDELMTALSLTIGGEPSDAQKVQFLIGLLA